MFRIYKNIEYRGCEYNVTGTFSVCADIEDVDGDSNTSETYISITDISSSLITGPVFGTECYDYFLEGLGYWFDQDIDALDDYLDIRDYNLAELWQSAYVEDFIGADNTLSYVCGIPENDGNLLVKYYESACYQRCYRQNEDTGFEVVNLRCGYSCCVKTTEYCVNAETGEVENSTPTFEQITNCSYEPEPNPSGCLFLGTCQDSCSPID